ncbi:MAG TPA: hypothetical protein ENJ28_10735 [Gammaproteobacteria bacterium]|nr:hypothetical protein [Gammaproteobacteria bacterium]
MFRYIIFILIFIIAAGSFFVLKKRRDLPFQEIVEFDESIAIINARDWYANKIGISISSDGYHEVAKLHYAENGVCIYKKKQSDKPIKIKLERTDLKGRILYKTKIVYLNSKKQTDQYIVLIGASVGSGWNFDRLTERINISPDIVFGFRPHYFFDKTQIIDKLIALPVPVYSVIIKECSAYFPRDIEKSISLVKEWIIKLQKNNILPVLATVVPVTEQRDQLSPGKMASLIQYNDSIRSLAATRKLPILDLEKALRISDKNRHLRKEYAQKDGTHLTPFGYAALDSMMEKNIKRLFRLKE